jgi:SAM-dependent methyltransferase
MQGYGAFARFYDSTVGDVSPKIEFLRSLIKKHKPDARTVLEMACGTGTILKGLSDEFEVAGLDLSQEMIEIARKKLPHKDIRAGDMTSFNFNSSFDVVLCVFDSINHLLKWEDWVATFDRARAHLNEGGLFIFDFNPEKRLEYLSSLPIAVTPLGEDYLLTKIGKDAARYFFDEKVFEKTDTDIYRMHHEVIYEASFRLDLVKNELAKSFEILEISNNRGLSEDHQNWRPFLVCKKK